MSGAPCEITMWATCTKILRIPNKQSMGLSKPAVPCDYTGHKVTVLALVLQESTPFFNITMLTTHTGIVYSSHLLTPRMLPPHVYQVAAFTATSVPNHLSTFYLVYHLPRYSCQLISSLTWSLEQNKSLLLIGYFFFNQASAANSPPITKQTVGLSWATYPRFLSLLTSHKRLMCIPISLPEPCL